MTTDELQNLSQRAAHHLPEEGGFDYAPESVTLTGHHYLAMTRLIREMKMVIDAQLKGDAS
jgi:hypothetical protein